MDKRLREILRFFVAPPRVFPLSVQARFRASMHLFIHKYLHLSILANQLFSPFYPLLLFIDCFRVRETIVNHPFFPIPKRSLISVFVVVVVFVFRRRRAG